MPIDEETVIIALEDFVNPRDATEYLMEIKRKLGKSYIRGRVDWTANRIVIVRKKEYWELFEELKPYIIDISPEYIG